jgi:hypothetical protein
MHNGVHQQGLLLPMQFEAESAQDRGDSWQADEHRRARSCSRGWRGQQHGTPALHVYSERSAKLRAVDYRQISPVLDVMGKVVQTDGFCVQRMPKPITKL